MLEEQDISSLIFGVLWVLIYSTVLKSSRVDKNINKERKQLVEYRLRHKNLISKQKREKSNQRKKKNEKGETKSSNNERENKILKKNKKQKGDTKPDRVFLKTLNPKSNYPLYLTNLLGLNLMGLTNMNFADLVIPFT